MFNLISFVVTFYLFVSATLADSSKPSSWMTETDVVTNDGDTYTVTDVELYTGQATTVPTSGTVTTTINVSNSMETYTKTMVITYGKASETTTHLVITEPSVTYTKTLSTDIADASAASSGSSGSSSESESSSKTKTKKSKGAANLNSVGTGMLGVVGAVAFLL